MIKIETKILIDKNLNKLIFLEELFGFRNSEWSKERRIEYFKFLEIKNISKYKNEFWSLLSDVPSGLLELIFTFSTKERASILKREFGEEKYIKIESLIKKLNKDFYKSFGKIWSEKHSKLLNIKKIINKNKKLIEDSILVLNSFLEIKQRKTIKINIYLIFGSENRNDINAFFSKFENRADIFIDGHFFDSKDENFSSLLIIHELTHLLLRESNKLDLLNGFARENKKQIIKIISENKLNIPNEIFFEELFISLFAPEGYFREKYFNQKIIKPKIKNGKILRFKDLRKLTSYKLKDILTLYLDQNKSLDKNLLGKIIKGE